MRFLFFDEYYFLLCIPAFIIALIAQINIKSSYKKYSNIRNLKGITGYEAVRRILQHYGITNVRIEQVSGELTDHFDPANNVIRLSPAVYNGISIASVGIACHEAGHAAQHAEAYFPIKVRNAIIPVTKIGSTAGLFLTVLGLIFNFEPLTSIGLLLYFFIVIFQFVTLPVEFNASRRALNVIKETNMLEFNEITQARRMLTAAAMTYVASLIVALAQFLRLFLRARGNRR